MQAEAGQRRGIVIAIVGAESTGKSTLAEALARRIHEDCGLDCTWVAEYLREWCVVHGRTPRPDEQLHILQEQAARVEAAAAQHDVVVCDTAPMQTAVYSRYLFADRALDDAAMRWHQRVDLTLLTALDLPWVPDTPRDGPHVRVPVDDMLRELLCAHDLPWAVVSGSGVVRVEAALAAVRPVLAAALPAATGLFSRLALNGAAASAAEAAAWRWVCDECAVPLVCEHVTAATETLAGGRAAA